MNPIYNLPTANVFTKKTLLKINLFFLTNLLLILFSPQLTAQLTVDLQIHPANCFEDHNGSITSLVSGGMTPYTYLWSNNETTQDLMNLVPGNYSLTVTDANAAQASSQVTLTEPDAIVSIVTIISHVNCNGGNNGAASVIASGGTPDYTYSWSDGQISQNATNLAAGDYNVTTTDANGCTFENNITITEPDAMTIDVQVRPPSCSGFEDGTVTLTPSGGAEPYTYLWSNNETTATIQNVAAGAYQVQVTDADGCSVSKFLEVESVTEITAITTVTHAPECNGDATGNISVIASGGTEPYTFNWSDGQVGRITSNQAAGNYSVTITDAAGCTLVKMQAIGQPDPISVSIVKKDASCGVANNGSIEATVSGGTPDYTYAWSNGATTASISDLSPGSYTLSVTDGNACPHVETFDVLLGGDDLINAIIITVKNASCPGANDGSLSVIASGGAFPYTYSWSNGNLGHIATNLTAGNYTVTVVDANGCTVIKAGTITEPDAMTVGLTKANVTCNGDDNGSARITVSGGNSPYKYLWSNGSTTDNINDLTPGNYSVTITDDNNCFIARDIEITEPPLLTLSANVVKSDPDNPDDPCNGSTGKATAVADGGTAPYISFIWSDGQTGATASNLGAGEYTVTVVDSRGCTANSSVIIESFPIMTLMTSVIDVSCDGINDGSATAMVYGGTVPFTYEWSDGQTEVTAFDLEAGAYTVTVTDKNGCSQVATAVVAGGGSLEIEIDKTDVNCNGTAAGTAIVVVAGGIDPYTYLWSTGETTEEISVMSKGNYSVTVTDDSGCSGTATVTIDESPMFKIDFAFQDALCYGESSGSILVSGWGGTQPYTYLWDNGSTDPERKNLAAGNYTVTVNDANGCTMVETITVGEADAISLDFTHSGGGCNGNELSSVTVNASGGTPPYVTYQWSDGQFSPTATNLVSGIYSVTVGDINGCKTVKQVTVNNSTAFSLSLEKSDISCNLEKDGSISANVSGGTQPYTYAWSNGASTSSISNLEPGTYMLTVTDAGGCRAEAIAVIYDAQMFKVDFAKQDALCIGEASGSLLAVGWGGTAPYTYLWDNGSTNTERKNLAAGDYNITVTDSHACIARATISIENPSPITIDFETTSAGASNSGTAKAIASGGGVPYAMYQWSDGQFGQTVTNLAAGSYTVTVTNNNGCTGVATVNIASGSASSERAVSFFPNPFNENVTVVAKETFKKNSVVRMLDSRGQAVKIIPLPEGSKQHNINTTNQVSGIYFLQMIDNNKSSKIYKMLKLE